jgi:hypothetical protein
MERVVALGTGWEWTVAVLAGEGVWRRGAVVDSGGSWLWAAEAPVNRSTMAMSARRGRRWKAMAVNRKYSIVLRPYEIWIGERRGL